MSFGRDGQPFSALLSAGYGGYLYVGFARRQQWLLACRLWDVSDLAVLWESHEQRRAEGAVG
jgi:hypothetical protein